MARPSTSHVNQVLQTRFGHKSLRPLQQRIVDRVMGGGDALVVMPTGSGKSLCYQLPALTLSGPGSTRVSSPLIALMEDQVGKLKELGLEPDEAQPTTFVGETSQGAQHSRAVRSAVDLDLDLELGLFEQPKDPST